MNSSQAAANFRGGRIKNRFRGVIVTAQSKFIDPWSTALFGSADVHPVFMDPDLSVVLRSLGIDFLYIIFNLYFLFRNIFPEVLGSYCSG
jgi:hypothetical protein